MQSETPPTPMEGQSGERVGGGKRRGKGSGHSEKNLKHQFIGIAEQGLHLLWNLRYVHSFFFSWEWPCMHKQWIPGHFFPPGHAAWTIC